MPEVAEGVVLVVELSELVVAAELVPPALWDILALEAAVGHWEEASVGRTELGLARYSGEEMS